MVGPSLKDIRRYNFQLLLDKHADGKKKVFSDLISLHQSSVSAMVLGRSGVTDTTKGLIEGRLNLSPDWLDENRIPADYTMPEPPPRKRRDADSESEQEEEIPVQAPAKRTGMLKFEADGFGMEMEVRGGNEDEAEITRLALRIVEVRSR